ncbi:MAG: DUF1579 domain-containing protein [Planctomycetota bacterium]
MRRSPTLLAAPFVAAAVVFVVVVAAAGPTFAQMPPQPTDEHRELAKEAGVWDAQIKVWMSPGAPPVESTGSETCEMLGKFWLISKFKGNMGGMPFQGRGQTTYDTYAGEWVTTWIDSMAPLLMKCRGSWDESTSTATYTGEGPDWITGETKQVKMALVFPDEDHKEWEMFERAAADEPWRKVVAIDYTRRK